MIQTKDGSGSSQPVTHTVNDTLQEWLQGH